MDKKRIGKFYISQYLIDACPDVLKILFGKMIILRAEYLFHRRSIEYIALCGEFDIVPEGCLPPEYMVNVDKDLNISVFKTG